jgi:citrate lyase beta subunit
MKKKYVPPTFLEKESRKTRKIALKRRGNTVKVSTGDMVDKLLLRQARYIQRAEKDRILLEFVSEQE